MKVLVIGGGGREHAIVWRLRQSKSVDKIWCAPGNGGIAQDAECLPLSIEDPRRAGELAARIGAELTIVGPELPLVAGIANEFHERGLAIVGPTAQASQLEGSKIFAKQFMQRHQIPTAEVYGLLDNPADAHMVLGSVEGPLVIKADGLCAGKGVLVTSSADQAADFLTRLMEAGEFGDAGRRVLLEQGLAGEELSYIILTDGTNFIPLVPTRDHKRAFDKDEGPNTGGMGAYSIDQMLPASLERKIRTSIVEPTLAGLREEGMAYRGFLYFGLMITSDGPKVLEYNCRLGDPETEAILLRADFDLAQASMSAATGSLAEVKPRWLPGASVCVVIASKGYPGNPTTGVRIDGLDHAAKVPGAVILHAGTRRDQGVFYTTGGRVLGVCARGATLADACATAYTAVSKIDIRGAHYRTDIGAVKVAKRRGASAPFESS